MSLLLLTKPATAGKQVVAPSNSLLHNSPGGVTTNHAMERSNHVTYMNDSASDLDMSPGPEEVKSYHHTPPQTTYASCFGLPYQDHNYGAPPPPTPPASPPPPIVQPTPTSLMPLSNSSSKMNGHIDVEDISGITEITTTEYRDAVAAPAEDTGMDDSVTRCVCDFQHDDGYMICCDRCSVWQHVDCMGVDRNNIPENYMCELCDPRRVDKQRAVQIQTRKRRELAHLLDTSATESENETKALGIDSTTGKKIKGKKKKDRDKLLLKEKKKRLTKKLKEKKDKFKQRQNKIQLSKKPKFGPGRRTFKKNNKITPLPPTSLPLSIKDDVKDPYAWESSPVESFEEARINQYSSDVLGILASRKFNGQHMSDVSPREQLRVQLCHVSQISMTTKGLEAAEDLSCDRPLIEYKGKVMLREQYDKENVFFKHCHPFVLFYSKFEDLDLCVDASSYGNDARYVRRSCTPNAEVRHYIENSKLHFYICSLKSICNGAEITIPFDYNYQDCNFAVECACTKSSCPITRFHRKVDMSSSQNNKMRKRRISSKSEVRSPPLPSISSSDEGPKSPAPKSPVRSPPTQSVSKRRKLAPLSPIRTNNKKILQQNNENTPAARRRTLSGPKSPGSSQHAASNSPKKSELKSPGSHNQTSSNTETDASPEQSEPQRKLSREERKMEAIMKAFQKMEEREHRRQEALHRLESTPTSPSAGQAKAAPRTKCGKSKSTEESKKYENRDGKDLLKMEPVVVIENTPTSLNGQVQVRGPTLGPTLRSSTMPRTKAASKAMPPQIAAMEAAEAAAAAAAAAALAASKPQEPSQLQSACSDVKVKEEGDDKYEPPKTRKGKRKRMSSGPGRRKSRMSSSASAASSTVDPFSSADESSNHAIMSQPPSEATTPTPSGFNKAFQFPKTKKHLMKEWLYEKGHEITKPLSIKTESLDIDGNTTSMSTGEDSVEFVHCLPSPSTNALSHLRRSSMSNCSNTRDAASNAVTSMGSSSLGSAKKRWLRKAMFETKQPGTTDSMSPVPSGSTSPNANSCSNSPGGSPPVANDFVTPLKKRRMARASMCAELPSFTSAAATPVPESPLVIEHRSASVGGESSNPEVADFTIPLLDAASLQRPEGDVPNRLPNGFRPPSHHFSSTSAESSTDNIFERITSSEKIDHEGSKQESMDVNPTSESVNRNTDETLTDTGPSLGTASEVKYETVKEEADISTAKVDASLEKDVQDVWDSEELPIKAEPESSVNSTAQSCLLTSSPVRGENSGAGSSCASSLSPVRASANCSSIVHTAATGMSPVKSETYSPSADKEQVDSTVDSCHTEMDAGEQDETRHHSSSSNDHSHLYHHHSSVITQPNCEVPTCSTVGSNCDEIDSTRERELDSDFARVSLGTHHNITGVDSEMDTQVDIVSHSEPCESDIGHISDNTLNQQTTPEEQQEVSNASQSQGFEVRLDVEEREDNSSSQVDSSEGSSIINRDHHIGVADSGQTSRSRHQSAAESLCSSRSRHESAADSISEHLEESGQPDSGQDLSYAHSRSMEGPEGDEVPQQSGADEVEEGEVSEDDEEHVGSSGAAQQQEEEIEEGEIVDDSDEERTTGDSPTSSSTNNTSQSHDSRVTEGGQVATKDDQAVSCSTDSGVEVSSGEDLNHSSESVSDGEVVQSSGITASTDPNLRRNNSQNQISSSDHTSSQTLSAVSAGISSDSGALPTCSSTDNLVGSSNRTAGLFSARLSSSSLTSSSSQEQKEGSSDTEVDSTSSHRHTVSRSGIHASRSPADVSSSSSLNQDTSNSRGTFGTFASRWQSGNAASVSVDPIPEEPSSSENHTSISELPHASTTFLSSNNASSSSNPSSTTNTSHAPQSKKKVSLLEYRKRMKSRSIDESSTSKSSERSSSLPTLPNTTLGAHLRNLRDSLVNKTSSTVTKTVVSSSGDHRKKDDKRPLSGRSTPSSSGSSSSSSGGRLTPSLPSLPLFSQKSDKGSSSKDETDVRWSLNPTAAEKLCEHANVSLTERLRRDFGIDAVGSDEEDKDERDGLSSGGESPPPPPPPPPPPKPSGSENKVSQQQNPVVYLPHHNMNIPPVGVQIPQAATGGLPGGQMPLPPPPKPPLNLQQPPAGNMVSQTIPQPLSSLTTSVPNNTAKAGQIPSLLSLPLGPAKKFSQNRVKQYECEDDQVEDVPPPPPPPLALQGYMQQPPITTGFPQHAANMAPTQPAPVQTFVSGSQPNPQSYSVSIPGAGPDPSMQQYNYQPQSTAAGPSASSAYNSPPTKGKSSKKSYQQGYSGKKYKHN